MTRLDRIDERGGSKLNLILALSIMGAMIFAAIKIVPVYVNDYEFQDAIKAEARFAVAGYPKKSEQNIREDVLKKAQELGIPLQPDNLRASITNGYVEITADYSVPIDLAVYQWTIQFHPHADNHTI